MQWILPCFTTWINRFVQSWDVNSRSIAWVFFRYIYTTAYIWAVTSCSASSRSLHFCIWVYMRSILYLNLWGYFILRINKFWLWFLKNFVLSITILFLLEILLVNYLICNFLKISLVEGNKAILYSFFNHLSKIWI